MEATPKAMRMTQVVDRLMLDLQTTEEIGYVAELLVDERHHQVVGLACRAGLMGQQRRFGWQQVASVGKDGVVLRTGTVVADDGLSEALPIAALEIWSEAGDRVGQLADFEFDYQTGIIGRYLFTPEPMTGLAPGLYGIAPDRVISAGRRRMMVKIEGVLSPDLVEAGWDGLPSAGETPSPRGASAPVWRVPGLPEDFRSRSQQLAHQAQERIRAEFQGRSQFDPHGLQDQFQEQWSKTDLPGRSQHLADQAKDQFGQVMNRFRKQSRRLRHQLRETVTDWSEELPNRSRPLHNPTQPHRPRRTVDVEPTEMWPDDDPPDSSN